MNEKDYQYVLMISQCKSISQAAEILYVSQPALSRYIKTLEKKLGILLFDRKSSPIQPTPAGQLFCSYAERILNLEGELYNRLRSCQTVKECILRIGVPPISGDFILSRILPRIARKYPFIKLESISDYSFNLYHRLAAHHIDLACAVADPPSFVTSKVFLYEPIFLVGARDHIALKKYDTMYATLDAPLLVEPEYLNSYPMIQYSHSYTEAHLRQMSYSPNSLIKVSSSPLALELAAKGIGFTSVMRSQLKYSRQEIVQSLCPISIGDCKLPFYLAYNKATDKTVPELSLLIEEITAEYANKTGL